MPCHRAKITSVLCILARVQQSTDLVAVTEMPFT